jgi:hypothetical protein
MISGYALPGLCLGLAGDLKRSSDPSPTILFSFTCVFATDKHTLKYMLCSICIFAMIVIGGRRGHDSMVIRLTCAINSAYHH